METYKNQSAIARCQQLQDGLWQADYTGPIGMTSALMLGRSVSRHTRQAKCTIERTDGALLLFNGVAEDEEIGYLIGSPPGCFICSDDSFEHTQRVCRQLARLGVIRVAFRNDELRDALAFSAAMLGA